MVQGQTPEEPLIDFLFLSGPKTTTWSIKTLPENPMGECAAIPQIYLKVVLQSETFNSDKYGKK